MLWIRIRSDTELFGQVGHRIIWKVGYGSAITVLDPDLRSVRPFKGKNLHLICYSIFKVVQIVFAYQGTVY